MRINQRTAGFRHVVIGKKFYKKVEGFVTA